jgi:HAD superfamily hydrolase (TIGR01509 family)
MIKAVIFDMDGVISDTQKLHSFVEMQILKEHGVSLNVDEITEKYSGIPDEIFFREVTEGLVPEQDLPEIIRKKWERMYEFSKDKIIPVPGAIELIRKLHYQQLMLGVASSSPKAFVKLVLSKLGVAGFFQAVITKEDVKKSKPDPEVFLTAAQRLGVRPDECVVIEDALSGIRGAKKAGMKCVAYVEEGRNPASLPADIIVRDLSILEIEDIV